MSSPRKRSSTRRTARLAGPFAAAVALGAIAAAPAQATIVGNSIEANENITVFHNIDFIAAFGTGAIGQQARVDVLRNGNVIGTSTGPLVDTPEGPGLEVNHGVTGAAGPGDCWTGYTPNIRPGDNVRVTNLVTSDVDEVIVDNITFDPAGPQEDATTGNILVHGVALLANGTPIPHTAIDSAEFRDGAFRGAPNDVVARVGGVPGSFTMIYEPPYELVGDGPGGIGRNDGENPLDEDQRHDTLLGDGHATGFGHVVPLPLESMLVDGIEDVPGPALGCEASTARVNGLITSADAINAATSALTLSGVKAAGVGSVSVSISGGPGAPVVVNAPVADPASTSWSVALSPAQITAVKALADGSLTATPTFNGTAGNVVTLAKDVVAPVVTPSLAPSTYTGDQSLSLTAGASELIEFSLNGGPWTPYSSEITLSVGAHTVQVRGTDAAGNQSVAQPLDYVINARPVVITEQPAQQQSSQQQSTQSTSSPVAPPVLNQPAPTQLAVSSFRLASRHSLATARGQGIEVAYRAPAGADTVTFAVYRVGAQAAARKALVKRSVKVSGTGRRTIRIRSAKFRAGRYTLEITPSQGGRKGATAKRSFQIRK